jgi:transposase
MDSMDRKRLYIIKQAVEGKISQRNAAAVLELTDRQIRRMVRRVKKEGDVGILHRKRGQASNNKIASKLKEKVIGFCKSRYQGFGPTLISEKLLAEQRITISDETVRRWLNEVGVPYKRRRDRPHRQWRARRECFGEMLQIDGSHHDWLEGRGPKLVLMGFIDDATNHIYGRFYDYEGTVPALDALKRYVEKFGIPCSIYSDRHTTYKSTKKLSIEEEMKGMLISKSQFERAAAELAIRVIHANSAPAKGRIERLFRTLQDRLVKEMRLKKISTKDAANEYLSQYLVIHNKRYKKAAARPNDVHRPVGKEINLDSILSIKTECFLRNDFTIAHNGKLYQIHDHVRARRVTVEQRLNGSVHVKTDDRYLRFTEIPLTHKTIDTDEEKPISRMGKARKPLRPGPDHPLKAGLFNRRVNSSSSVPPFRAGSHGSPVLHSGTDDQQQPKNRTF